jgi:hypothetical protein
MGIKILEDDFPCVTPFLLAFRADFNANYYGKEHSFLPQINVIKAR